MNRAGRIAAAVIASVVAASPAVATAQNKPKKPSKVDDKARKHFELGEAYYAEGNYEDAITEYEKAYELSPRPELVFNIAQAHRLQGDRAQAKASYERLIALAPDHWLVADARKFIAELDQETAAIESSGQPRTTETRPVVPPPGEHAAQSTPSSGESQALGPETDRSAASVDDSPPTGPAVYGLEVGGAITAAAGVIAIGVGVKYGLDARRISDELSDHTTGPWPDELIDRQQQGESAERKMIILTAAGGAAVVAGGLLYVFGRTRRARSESREIAVAPAIGGSDVGLVLTGGF